MSRKLPPEDAFAYYVAMGVERSYKAVAAHFRVSKRAVVKLAAKDEWTSRLAKIEEKSRARLDEKLVEDVEAVRLRHRKMLRAMAARSAKAIQDYPLNSGLEGVKAAEIVIKLERLILGEATERTEMNIEEVTKKEIANFLKAVDEPDEEDKDDDGEAPDAGQVEAV